MSPAPDRPHTTGDTGERIRRRPRPLPGPRGSWVTVIVATYAEEDLERAQEAFGKLREKMGVDAVSWAGSTVTIVDDYKTDSDHPCVRPAREALRAVFDPIANDDRYWPWPRQLLVRTEWQTSPSPS